MSTRARRCGLVAAQAGCAALAFSTAAATSAFDASGTLARSDPSMGWNTSPKRPEVPFTCWPPMKCVSSAGAALDMDDMDDIDDMGASPRLRCVFVAEQHPKAGCRAWPRPA